MGAEILARPDRVTPALVLRVDVVEKWPVGWVVELVCVYGAATLDDGTSAHGAGMPAPAASVMIGLLASNAVRRRMVDGSSAFVDVSTHQRDPDGGTTPAMLAGAGYLRRSGYLPPFLSRCATSANIPSVDDKPSSSARGACAEHTGRRWRGWAAQAGSTYAWPLCRRLNTSARRLACSVAPLLPWHPRSGSGSLTGSDSGRESPAAAQRTQAVR